MATVIVTGASLGVGRATAEAFANKGANVVLVARRRGPLEEVAATLDANKVLVCVADVGDLSALKRIVDEAVARFGEITGLVNNAAVHTRGPVEGCTPEQVAAMVDVNLRGPLVLSRMVLPHLRAAGGFIVNVASLAGKAPIGGAAAYSSTKFGLRVFTFALAEELRGSDIRVSVVSPGPIATSFIMDNLDDVEDITFSQEMCTAEDVASMVVACSADGRRERHFPVSGGRLATVAYLWPSLRRWVRPMLARKGARVKANLKARR